MLSSEIISIIAVSISGVTSICAAVIPAVLSFKVKKEELKAKLEREKQQAYETKFEEFYQEYITVLNNFSNFYANWKNTFSEIAKSDLVIYVSTLSLQFCKEVQTALNDFANKIKNYKDGDNFDKDYKNCINLILKNYGINISCMPDILLPDILKGALKIQFDKLQNLKTDCFNRLHFS